MRSPTFCNYRRYRTTPHKLKGNFLSRYHSLR
ncbi:Protein of unknown function [Pyronema omphalodes CBS 100304]|uniref:Uncharacterized protein n=1 Tax=Pyronema omphalodes (strain CBS 100304) TaxID=1076935 RepID=U4LDM0_PYROM|nr:Protein of unknown function [Pyronema omphalodes CBS 100304]